MSRPSLFQFVLLFFFAFSSFSNQSSSVQKIEDYNRLLPLWGTTWTAGSDAINGYYPSFYTGFAMRSQFPDRIHVRVARGNQTRVSVILDDQTIKDYLFDLAKRYEFYNKVSGSQVSPVTLASKKKAKTTPHLDYFNQIVESPVYGILDFVKAAQQRSVSDQQIYAKALDVLRQLNPGRVFLLKINLINEFQKWKELILKSNVQGDVRFYQKNPAQAIVLLNSIVWGRINLTEQPNNDVLEALAHSTRLALEQGDEVQFLASALKLFKMVAEEKYDFNVLDNTGQWQKALQCPGPKNCYLVYPEFTTIYPTGSVEEKTSDNRGNRINSFATPGLWKFLSRQGRHDVDNIRSEPYYGWIPKMDYEAAGNGFHNPAVRFYGVGRDAQAALAIPKDHKTLWSVKRGGVSHGCLRLSAGHVWELRQIFPVENDKMVQVHHFGNLPQDFDVYDIDGDGQLEVMGVEYFISYSLQGSSGLARREGGTLEISSDKKLDFYTDLYGARDVFTVANDGKYYFRNPTISLPSYLDFRRKSSKARLTIQGNIPLYEQTYEKDKLQLYVPTNASGRAISASDPAFKQLIRLMGRVRGCAPTSDKNKCGEKAFDQEARQIFSNLNFRGLH